LREAEVAALKIEDRMISDDVRGSYQMPKQGRRGTGRRP
jgi:hypothetical protein